MTAEGQIEILRRCFTVEQGGDQFVVRELRDGTMNVFPDLSVKHYFGIETHKDQCGESGGMLARAISAIRIRMETDFTGGRMSAFFNGILLRENCSQLKEWVQQVSERL